MLSMAGAALTPRVRILAICDRVRESQTESGVFHLTGVRQEIVADAFPFVPSRLWLFLLLSSVRAGEFTCYIRIVKENTDQTVFYSYLQPRPRFEADRSLWASRAPIRCAFPEAGRYTVQLWFFQEDGNDVLKGELPFNVVARGTQS
jgi:hypothetical protein